MTYRASSVRVVGRDEEGELEHGSTVDASTNTQQTIPNCGGYQKDNYTINFVYQYLINDCTCTTILLIPTYLVERHQMGECTLQALGAEAVGNYMYMDG